MSRRPPRQSLATQPEPQVTETFCPLSILAIHRQTEPSCFNGMVRVHRWRITVERIEEPPEIIAARVRELWKKNDNPHHMQALRQAACDLGINLDSHA